MSTPSVGEKFAELIEHLRRAQEAAAMLGHLHADDGGSRGKSMHLGWLAVSEGLKQTQKLVTNLATKGRLN